MGCDICKIDTPQQYQRCEELKTKGLKKGKTLLSPCGGCFIGVSPGNGTNYTPPKRKRKKK